MTCCSLGRDHRHCATRASQIVGAEGGDKLTNDGYLGAEKLGIFENFQLVIEIPQFPPAHFEKRHHFFFGDSAAKRVKTGRIGSDFECVGHEVSSDKTGHLVWRNGAETAYFCNVELFILQ